MMKVIMAGGAQVEYCTLMPAYLYHRLTVDLYHLVEPLKKCQKAKGDIKKVRHLSMIASILFFDSLLLSVHERHLETQMQCQHC